MMKSKSDLLREYLENKYSNSKREDIVAANEKEQRGANWQAGIAGLGAAIAGNDVGRAVTTVMDRQKSARDDKLSSFDKSRSRALQDFQTSTSLDTYDENQALKSRLQDPNSFESKLARETAQKMMPDKDFTGMNAATLERAIPSITKLYQADQTANYREALINNANYKREKQKAKEDYVKSPKGKLESLSGSDKARFDNALMVLKNIDDMATALENGENTYSFIGDNSFTEAQRRATEAYGRMQSGGAINKEEEDRFQKTLPNKWDSEEIQRQKLLKQREEMISRLKTLGFSMEEVGYKPKEIKYGLKEDPNEQRIQLFMEKNNITDRTEAEKILKEKGLI